MKTQLALLLLIGASFSLYGEGTCKKCEVLRKYHDANPCPYEYYEDYIKALEEKKEIPKKVKPEELLKEEAQPELKEIPKKELSNKQAQPELPKKQ